MRLRARAKLVMFLASAALPTMICSRALAQADEIPDTVPVTNSRIRGGTWLTVDELSRLTQLGNDELRARLRGVRIHPRTAPLLTDSFSCDDVWGRSGELTPRGGRYSVRDNQVCMGVTSNGSGGYCIKLFRNETGELFGETTGIGIMPLEVTPVEACPQP